ncbi:hypothetical protein R1flu_021043 [Riccia fluitans]|uniref:Uncharacterized protein n=1 Tax=Riccia fluitans TaxID=41844 RepID=A0ABD1ZNJ6_9MARC
MADERSDKPRRRRRKNKSKKTSAGDMSPVSTIPDESGSAPSNHNKSQLQPDRVFGEDSFVYPSDWPVGISPTESSPSVPAESPNAPASSNTLSVQRQTSSLGVLKDYGSGSPSGWDFRESDHLDSAKRLAEVGSKLTSHGAEDDFRSTEVLKENLNRSKEDGAVENAVFAASFPALRPAVPERSPLRSLSFRGNLPPGSPDFSAANGGMMEPSFAPGTLYPPGELRQRLTEKIPKKQSDDKAIAEGSTGKVSSLADSNPGASSDERAAFPPPKSRLGTLATPQLKDWERLMASNNLYPLGGFRRERFEELKCRRY